MDDLKVTRIDLTEIDVDSLDGVEASGGNWKKSGGFYYKIVNAWERCSNDKKYVKGPNSYPGKRKDGCCSSCKFIIKKSGYNVCELTKKKSL